MISNKSWPSYVRTDKRTPPTWQTFLNALGHQHASNSSGLGRGGHIVHLVYNQQINNFLAKRLKENRQPLSLHPVQYYQCHYSIKLLVFLNEAEDLILNCFFIEHLPLIYQKIMQLQFGKMIPRFLISEIPGTWFNVDFHTADNFKVIQWKVKFKLNWLANQPYVFICQIHPWSWILLKVNNLD